jgi:hypothetical protein
MAAKNAKKQKKKGKKNQIAKEKKISVPKKAEAKEGIPKIVDIVKDGLSAKLAYEEILKNVLKHHPESKFNKKHLAWYKNRLGLKKTI